VAVLEYSGTTLTVTTQDQAWLAAPVAVAVLVLLLELLAQVEVTYPVMETSAVHQLRFTFLALVVAALEPLEPM